MPIFVHLMRYSALFLALFAVSTALAGCGKGFAKAKPAGSTLKVVMGGGGHGSGVHIGDRFVLTAYHVVTTSDTVTLQADDGSIRPAIVLWANKDFDVALLRYAKNDNIAASPLVCREAFVGEQLRAKGNPGTIEFIQTAGIVSGAARRHGPWASVFVFDGTVAPGMSGGPVFDNRGNVVGLTVGLMAVPMGFASSPMPISYIVPSTVVCDLLARRA